MGHPLFYPLKIKACEFVPIKKEKLLNRLEKQSKKGQEIAGKFC